MGISVLHERIYEVVEQLSDEQLQEVLLFMEFLNTREDEDFVKYVNQRTQEALDARGSGKKFHSLEELQSEFSGASQ